VLFDEERAKIVVADDSASDRRVSNIHVDFVVSADVEEKLRQWKSGQWERKRCAQEHMALGYDARCIMGMVDRKEISKKRAQQIFAQFFGLSNEVNDESEQKDVNALHQRAWTKATFLISQGKAFQQTPLVGLIPVANFSARKLEPGARHTSMVMLYGLLVDALSAAADDQPPQPGVEPLQPFTDLMELFKATSGHDSLRAVTCEMISAAQRDLAIALLGSQIPGGLCHRFGQSIKDHPEWSRLRDVMPDYRLPSEEAAESRRLGVKHAVDETVTFIPLFGGKRIRSLVCDVLPGNRYRLCAKGEQWEDSGARLEKYTKKPRISSSPFLHPPPPTSDKTNRSNVGGPSDKANGVGVGGPSDKTSEQLPNKRLKSSGEAAVKTNDNVAGKPKRKRTKKPQRKSPKAAKKKKTNPFEVSYSQMEETDDVVFIAEVRSVDGDDSDDSLTECGALDHLRRNALLTAQKEESRKKLLLERQKIKLAKRLEDQKKEYLERVQREKKHYDRQEVCQCLPMYIDYLLSYSLHCITRV
jgi:hypothetical protein